MTREELLNKIATAKISTMNKDELRICAISFYVEFYDNLMDNRSLVEYAKAVADSLGLEGDLTIDKCNCLE